MTDFRTRASSPSRRRPFPAAFTVDVEQDCPPYLHTHRGMTEGMPRLLELLAELRIRGTFFTTGEMARRFPEIVQRMVDEGHELGCHGDSHRDFTTLTRLEAHQELRDSLATLQQFAPVVSFRAPYLRFPVSFLPLLPAHGLRIDSSAARYKFGLAHNPRVTPPGLWRIPASLTSSILRLPALLRRSWLALIAAPTVLFVHPWEAVDLRNSSLRWDCRFRTGAAAVALWRDVLRELQEHGAQFVPLREMVPP